MAFQEVLFSSAIARLDVAHTHLDPSAPVSRPAPASRLHDCLGYAEIMSTIDRILCRLLSTLIISLQILKRLSKLLRSKYLLTELLRSIGMLARIGVHQRMTEFDQLAHVDLVTLDDRVSLAAFVSSGG